MQAASFNSQPFLNTIHQSRKQKQDAFIRDVMEGNTDAALATIREGNINLSSVGPGGNTALHHACERNNGEIIKALSDAGVNIEVKNAKGFRPYEMPGLKDDYFQLLKERQLEDQFRKDVADNDIDKALSTICEGKVNVSSYAASGNTALHYACRSNNVEMMMALVNAGADLEMSNSEGTLACDLPCLESQTQAILQDVGKCQQALADLDRAMSCCTHTTSQIGYSTFNNFTSIKLRLLLNNQPEQLKRLLRTKVALQTAIEGKKFLMACEPLSMLFSSLLMEKNTKHSIQILMTFLKSNPDINHAFVVINNNDNHPFTIGSQQKVYIVDAIKGKSFFSYIDEEVFLYKETIPYNQSRCNLRTDALKNLCGEIPSALDVPEVHNLTYAPVTLQKAAGQVVSDDEAALQSEIVRLGRELVELMKQGQINVLHDGILLDRFSNHIFG